MQSGISVIICCYNSAKRLPETLKFLAHQQMSSEVPWEVVVVDNNSSDNTSSVAYREWQQYALPVPFQVVFEPQAGLSFAREKGFSVSRYEYVLFCDDDNWLDKNYLQHVFEIMRSDDTIGALGGESIAVSTVNLPSWFLDYQENFAVGKQAEHTLDVTEKSGFVWGAGMVVRYSAWQFLKEQHFEFLQTDRKGNNLSSGGDVELCYFLRLLGYRIVYSHLLKLEHFMPPQRLSWDYFRKLRRGVGSTSAYLDVYRFIEAAIKDGTSSKYPLQLAIRQEIRKFVRSPKQLYFFFFKDLEKEQHIINREYQYGRIRAFLELLHTYDQARDRIKKAIARSITTNQN